MAVQIPSIIPPESFEIVRDRIAQILFEEIANQFALSGEDALDLTQVALERTVPFDKTEMPCINVNLQRSTQETQVAVNTDEITLFNIDCYQSGISGDGNSGDILAKLKLHRLMGVVRSILENPRYKTLGFAPGFIMNRHVMSMDFAPVDDKDSLSVSMGRVLLSVKIPENTELITPTVSSGFDTKLTIGLTDKGYQYTAISDPINPILTEWDKFAAENGRGYNFPQPTGQTTVYRIGDDADIENIIFAPIRAANSLKAHNGLADFLTLANNNSFGNTNRFTDINGLQVYGNDYVIDNYTGIGWYRVIQSNSFWNDAIDNSLSEVTAGGFSDWFLPSRTVLLSIMLNTGGNENFNYSPFNQSVYSLLTSSSAPLTPTSFLSVLQQNSTLFYAKATILRNYFISRKHF